MDKDSRYIIIKKLILSNQLKSLAELVEIITETTLKKDLKTHYNTLSKKLKAPELFTFADAYKIAALVEVDEKYIVDLVHAQYVAEKKGKRKR